MNRTVLVTGGAGFIGSSVVRQLLAETDWRVLNVDKLTYAGNLASLGASLDNARHTFAQVDIADSHGIRELLEEHRPAAILHLAAESHVDRSIDAPGTFIETNIVGTYTLLHEALHYWRSLPPSDQTEFRFVHVSTDEVFGELGDTGYFDELTAYHPNSPYSASKAASDHLARAWHATYGLPVIVTNCSNNYGPCQFPEKLIPLAILNARDERELPVYGRGENVRDWIFVEDHAQGLRLALERGTPGETYLFGGNAERRNIDVVKTICALMDEMHPRPNGRHEDLIRFVTDRPGHDFRYAIDATKAKGDLGWQPSENFDSGLRRTIEWYLANVSWVEHVRSGEYRGERLGLSPAGHL